MTTDHDKRTRLVVSWLREDAHENAERVLLGALNEIDHTPQRRAWWPAWRFAEMNDVAKFLVAAAAVVAVVFAGINMLPRSSTGPGGQPSPSSTPTPTTTPSSTSGVAAGLPEGPFELADHGMTMTATIPASGWTFDASFTALSKGKEVANLPEATVLFWSFPAGTEFYVYGDPCRSTSTKPDSPVTSANEIAAGLATQASREASVPTDVTIGGHSGKAITLHVPDDAMPGECEQGEFVSYGTADDPLARYHQGPGQIDELWIVDVDGATLIIDAMYRQDTPAALVGEMRAIAESVTFGAP
jgi:hypothetical protein